MRLSIRAKVLILALVLALPALLVVSFFGLSSLDRAHDSAVESATGVLRTEAEQNLAKRAADKSKLYNTSLFSVQQQVESVAAYARVLLASEPPPAGATSRVWISPDGPTIDGERTYATSVARAHQFVPLLIGTVRYNPLVSLGYIALDDGGVIAFDHDIVDILSGIKPFDVRQRGWYTAAQQARRTVWVDTYIDANTKQPVVTCATPLYGPRGEFVGVVGFDMLLETIQQDVLKLDLGERGYAFLINGQGKMLVRPDMPVGQAGWNERLIAENLLEAEDARLRAVAGRMIRQEQGVERIFYDGGNVYLAFAPIPSAGWSVGIVVPEAAIVKPATDVGAGIVESQRRLRAQIYTVIGVSLAAVLVTGAILSILLSRPLRRMAEAAQSIAAGNLDQRVPVGNNDEIGDLGHAFNTMTAALRQMVDELEENLRQLARLNEVSNRFKTILSLPQLLEAIPPAVCHDFGFDRAALYLVEGDRLRAVGASFGPGHEHLAAEFIAVANAEPLTLASETVEADVVRSGQAVIVDNPWHHPRVPQAKQRVARSESYVQVPIFGHRERVIGVLAADYHHRQQPIQARDAAQLLAFAGMVGLTIEGTRLYNDLERQVAQRTDELRAALVRAQEADRLKGEFLAAISHELRTPLNAIIGFSSVLADELDPSLTVAQREDLQTINQNGRYLLHLINELLDLARIESGKLELQLEPIDVANLIGEAVDTAQGLLYDKPVALRVAIAPGLPPVCADQAKLRQILLNLLANAVKFTSQGEICVTVRAAVLPPRGAPTHAGVNGNGSRSSRAYVAFSIRDTGIGIAAEHLPVIFEEFRQVHAQRTGKRGSGLGLAIARRLVEAHRGRIWVESTPEQGSTFTFVLPAGTVEEPEHAETAYPREGSGADLVHP